MKAPEKKPAIIYHLKGQTHVFTIDLSAVEVVVNDYSAATITTEEFASAENTDVAVNASFFRGVERSTYPLGVTVSNYAAWPNIYWEPNLESEMGLLYCDREDPGGWTCRIEPDYRKAMDKGTTPAMALTGYKHLVRGGEAVTRDRDEARARTAIGVSQDGKQVFIAAVPEGKVPDGYYENLALILLATGAHEALNFDGGGSTALAVKVNGRPSMSIQSSRKPPTHFGVRLKSN